MGAQTMTDPAEAEWIEIDALNLLGLAVWRWRISKDFPEDPQHALYSNGTEHELATETADRIVAMCPALGVVVRAGLEALGPEHPAVRLAGYVMTGHRDLIAEMEAAVETWEEA